ncbi:hypothetical protein HDV00_010363 [Rhizophlyctis rosea]|nr:hypothetical protein HDV00_010363 [Rhizophlyctis rosea]
MRTNPLLFSCALALCASHVDAGTLTWKTPAAGTTWAAGDSVKIEWTYDASNDGNLPGRLKNDSVEFMLVRCTGKWVGGRIGAAECYFGKCMGTAGPVRYKMDVLASDYCSSPRRSSCGFDHCLEHGKLEDLIDGLADVHINIYYAGGF